MGRRVLVTGLGTFWGGRVAQALEADPAVDVIIGLDTDEPRVRLERTEYVRSDENYSILSRIVQATGVDTIVHTFLVIDSTQASSRAVHETNVIGTMNLFAAASAPDSTVRTIVVKSASLVYGCAPQDPYWFQETSRRSALPRTSIERSLLEVEGYVRDFATDNPHVRLALLRFSNVLGRDIVTPLSTALNLPIVPKIAGYDPRFQFVHETDVVAAILFVMSQRLAGVFNVAGDGQVPWTEVASIVGKDTFPLLPYGTGVAAGALRRLGIVDLAPEVLTLLRYGRGVDNRRLKEAGFRYGYTSAGAVKAFAEEMRLRATVGTREREYRYQEDVERWFRHSSAVLRNEGGR